MTNNTPGNKEFLEPDSPGVSLIGSTGSVGRQTLEVMERLNLRPVVLAAGCQAALLEGQCRRYRPLSAVLADEVAARDLKQRLADTSILVMGGAEAVCAAAAHPLSGTTVIAASGLAGLRPALTAVDTGRRVALANKECLVCAGELLMSRVQKHRTPLLPVDSELSAIFQCLEGRDQTSVKRVILTASGGPFWGRSRREMEDVTPAEALAHPTWRMGPKITVDCASLLNKGYELWETMYIFGLPPDRISVIIHRESVVHSLVEFTDGVLLAQMGVPDMRTPIQYALTYPERKPTLGFPLDLTAGPLTFFPPDTGTFPCLALAAGAAGKGGMYGAVLASAGEAAVARFLSGSLPFPGIADCLEAALSQVPNGDPLSLDDILEAGRSARTLVREYGR